MSEMEHLARLSGEYGSCGVRFLGVVTSVHSPDDKDVEEALDRAACAGVKYPQLVVTPELVGGVSYLPTTFVYGGSGALLAVLSNTGYDDLVNVIETALAAL